MSHTLRLVDPLDERTEPSVSDYPFVGAYLKAAREHRGKSLAEIAAATRVGRTYLGALEGGDYSILPSRPFSIGYVRAYARALELDEDAVAARFKAETPDTSSQLQPPIGVRHEKPERSPLVFALVGVAVLAVVGWNVAQRAMTAAEAPQPSLSSVLPNADAEAPTGPISLGAPIPPPAEQTMPAPYVTPGLAANPQAAPPPPSALITPILDRSAPVVFTPKAPVAGVPAVGPTVVLFAKTPASLIVRGPAGQVHFARQLAAGESYRAPVGQKLTAEVTDPDAFAVYVNNQLQGALTSPQTPLDRVMDEVLAHQPPPPRPAPTAAQPVAQAQAPTPAPAAARPAASTAAPAPAPRPVAARPAATAPRPAPRPAAAQPAPLAPPPLIEAPAPAPAPEADEPPLF